MAVGRALGAPHTLPPTPGVRERERGALSARTRGDGAFSRGAALLPWHAREGGAWSPGHGGDAPHDPERPSRGQGHAAGLAGGNLPGSATSPAEAPSAPLQPGRLWASPRCRAGGFPRAQVKAEAPRQARATPPRTAAPPAPGAGSPAALWPPATRPPNRPRKDRGRRRPPSESATFRGTLRGRPARSRCACARPTCARSPVRPP